MNATQLAGARRFYARQGESGYYRFVQNCLEGTFGDDAQSAASGVLAAYADRNLPLDDRTVSHQIVEAVESAEEGPDVLSVRHGGAR